MSGRVFKVSHAGNQTIDILASFGGLLMKVTGDQSNLANIQNDMRSVKSKKYKYKFHFALAFRIFLLMRKGDMVGDGNKMQL